MRRLVSTAIVATVLSGASALAAGAAPSVAPAAAASPAPVVQHQTGLAFGTVALDIFGDPQQQFDGGDYAATGQLGRGTYRFQLGVATDVCIRAGDRSAVSGTATLTRSDGATLSGTVTGSNPCFAADPVPATYDLALTHGTRDLVGAHLRFAGTFVLQVNPSGDSGTESFSFSGTSSASTRVGYWMLGQSGSVYAFGGVDQLGSAPTAGAAEAVAITPTPARDGYWIVDDAGHVVADGTARWFGNADPNQLAAGEHVTSISATPSGGGYWLFTDRGRELPFGNAFGYGDLRSVRLNGPVVGSAATPTGKGYYMVARDGGVFAFGDARFRGSMGATRLNRPVIGLVPTAANDGYWLVASDGGVFSFGAPFLGSMGGVTLRRPVVGMVRYGTGYMMVAADGGIFDFSRQPFFGSLGATPPAVPIVAAAAAG